jgi:hypothetical protein
MKNGIFARITPYGVSNRHLTVNLAMSSPRPRDMNVSITIPDTHRHHSIGRSLRRQRDIHSDFYIEEATMEQTSTKR